MADETTVIPDTSNGTAPDAEPLVEPTADTLPRKEDGTIDEEKLLETNRKLYARTKKAEADAKAAKTVTPPAKPAEAPVTQNSEPVDVDERVLKANGMPDELLTQLKDIATLRKVSLIDAQKDDLFVAIKEKFDKEQKSKAAALGPSRGSGGQAPKKDLNTPGLTREEHKALVMGK